MDNVKKPVTIVIAEDDDDSYFLIEEAFRESRLINHIHRVVDGEELLDFLLSRGKYQSNSEATKPGLILLDLNMPRKDGREVLKEIKEIPELKKIPVIVMTASKAEEDVAKSYDLGASSYIRKPVSFVELVEVMNIFKRYWLEIVELLP